ncbi:uncharacterized protein LOC134824192 [Bolinopsis microptera]|uniref:uncharacterized protein LOC134824192 n=1 Tax=Bolinopsis microptera TaxID=2820187 RepID=UPI003078F662
MSSPMFWNMMTIIAGLSMLLMISDAEIQCIQGANSTAPFVNCPVGTVSCYRPKLTEHVGFASGVDYGCGPCDPELSFECAECSVSGCNQPPVLEESYSCYNYKVAGGAITRHPTLTTCWRSKGSAITCNMPASTADYKSVSGCGPCGETAKERGTCVECYSDSCNQIVRESDRAHLHHRTRRSVSAECVSQCPYS